MDYKILFSQTKELSLLLVEDHELLRNDLAEILEDFFKVVTVAADGQKALDLYQKYHEANNRGFDMVITDIEMPLMNGVELSRAIRNISEDQQIIVLSAYTHSDYLLELINLGIAQFITKPINRKELLDTLCLVSKKINTLKSESEKSLPVDLGEKYIWDREKLILKEESSIVELTRYEQLLMELFVDKIEQACTNDDIIDTFYTHDININKKNIRNLVSKLRKKLPEELIDNVYGLGYMLTPS